MFEDRDSMLMYNKEIRPAYNKYVKEVSNRVMAASMECCVFLMVMCKDIKPKKVLDLGSGFSSYALRYYKNKYYKDMEVWSVDSNDKWLLKSKQFIKDYGLNTDHFYTWEEMMDIDEKFDLVFLDIDASKNRPAYLKPVIENFMTSDSFILLDDMHKGGLAKRFKAIMDDYMYDSIDVKNRTLDSGGRRIRFCDLYYNIKDNVPV
jgi:predicted O-methyltransferase YrrM